MAAYERVTLNRGGRNSRFDCSSFRYIFMVLVVPFSRFQEKPSSACQRVWLKIRRTFHKSICTELKGLIS